VEDVMQLRDGFIVSIFNYCDRWCETCAFTGQCRLFADLARAEARHDPGMAGLVHLPSWPGDVPRPAPKAMTQIFRELNEAAGNPLTDHDLGSLEPAIPLQHEVMCARAMDYAVRAHHCLERHGRQSGDRAHNPVAVIEWFSTMIASKMRRALSGLAEFDGDRTFPPDHEGCAKVVLLALERSHAAWSELLVTGFVEAGVAQREMRELEWLRAELDAAIPNARRFVRPGFDEPEARSLARAERLGTK
jgi:hypothetical protein